MTPNKFSRSGDLVFWICVTLFTVCSIQGEAHYTNLYTTNKITFGRNSSGTVRLMKVDVMAINSKEKSSKQAVLLYRLLAPHMYYYYGYHELCARSGIHIPVLLKVRVLGELSDPKIKISFQMSAYLSTKFAILTPQ